MSATAIAIDIGNTATDIGLIDVDSLRCIRRMRLPTANGMRAIATIAEQLASEHGSNSIPVNIASVSGDANDLFALFEPRMHCIPGVNVRFHPGLPFRLQYEFPEAFGADRVANCLYARRAFPDSAALIIDIGTTVNIEFISADGCCPGGAIFPGPAMQLSSLHAHTAALPRLTPECASGEFPGNSTTKSIFCGVRASIAGGLESIVGQAAILCSDEKPVIIVCGGAWKFIEKSVTFDYVHVPDCTLTGIALAF